MRPRRARPNKAEGIYHCSRCGRTSTPTRETDPGRARLSRSARRAPTAAAHHDELLAHLLQRLG
jgi:hypothetical protein